MVSGRCLLLQRRDHAEAVDFRHLNVEEDQVRLLALDERDRRLAVAALGHNLQVGFFFQQAAQTLARQGFVVAKQHSNGHWRLDLLSYWFDTERGFSRCIRRRAHLPASWLIVVVKLLQAGAGVAQANAFGWQRAVPRVRPSPSSRISIHSSSRSRQVEMRMKPGRAARADAVANGVLHQRLQNQVRHQRAKVQRIDVDLHLQAVLEARLLNVNVLLQEQ